MIRNVTDVRPIGDRRLWLRFDDGAEGEINLDDRIEFTGVFEPMQDPKFFDRVAVNEFGTIAWPNEADLDPIVLYSWATGAPLPDWASQPEVV
ncbi:MAG: DUF2442 domain-containing protein [Candidatus Sericytochromatia bacterium]|nr:DUF2442 domain-containing protein [Candidatus Tanganyikabacteria bacterium]